MDVMPCEIGVIGDDPHAEGPGAHGHPRPDLAQTDHTQRFTVELDAHKGHPVPFAGLDACIGPDEPSGEAEHHAQDLLGDGDRVFFRGKGHHDPQFRGGTNIHVVDAHAGPSDHLTAGGGLQQPGGHLRLIAHDHRIVLIGYPQEFLRLLPKVLLPAAIVFFLQTVDPRSGDVLGYENSFRHCTPPASTMPLRKPPDRVPGPCRRP